MEETQWEHIKVLVESQFRLDRKVTFHAEDHWNRVLHYGLLVARESGADLTVVRLFAWLHDSQRHEETWDPEHGPRAAEYARWLCQQGFARQPPLLTSSGLELLTRACHDHDRGFTSSDPTIGTCWDADRLDLDRVNIDPDPLYMSTDYGRRLCGLYPKQRRQLAGL